MKIMAIIILAISLIICIWILIDNIKELKQYIAENKSIAIAIEKLNN